MPTWGWIIIGIVVVLIVLGLVALLQRRHRVAARRAESQRIRQSAEEQAGTVRRRDAEAAETEASARKARAEADERRAQAERLEAEAQDRQEHARTTRAERDEQLRRADELDPDHDAGPDGEPERAAEAGGSTASGQSTGKPRNRLGQDGFDDRDDGTTFGDDRLGDDRPGDGRRTP